MGAPNMKSEQCFLRIYQHIECTAIGLGFNLKRLLIIPITNKCTFISLIKFFFHVKLWSNYFLISFIKLRNVHVIRNQIIPFKSISSITLGNIEFLEATFWFGFGVRFHGAFDQLRAKAKVHFFDNHYWVK